MVCTGVSGARSDGIPMGRRITKYNKLRFMSTLSSELSLLPIDLLVCEGVSWWYKTHPI